MKNTMKEFLETLDMCEKKISDIKSIIIAYEKYPNPKKILIDSENGTLSMNDLMVLDFEYDNGFGGQELFGYVIFKDNTWLERGEYDGSEWWKYQKFPTYNEIKEKIGEL
jgi:hypothetical protein